RWPRDWSSDVCSSDLLARGIALEIDLVADLLRNGRIAAEVAADAHLDAPQRDALGLRLAEEVVRDAACDREVEELPAVEPEPARSEEHTSELQARGHP